MRGSLALLGVFRRRIWSASLTNEEARDVVDVLRIAAWDGGCRRDRGQTTGSYVDEGLHRGELRSKRAGGRSAELLERIGTDMPSANRDGAIPCWSTRDTIDREPHSLLLQPTDFIGNECAREAKGALECLVIYYF